MKKNIMKIVFVIIGTMIGAGFASGQEIYLFFFSYGLEGVTKISNTKFYTSYANDTIRNTVVKISK